MTQTEKGRVRALLVGSGVSVLVVSLIVGAFIGGDYRGEHRYPARVEVHTVYCTPALDDLTEPFRCDWDYWSQGE